MFSQQLRAWRRLRGRAGTALTLALPVLALSACAPAIGGGVLVVAVGIGVLTSHCYDYVDVSVFDDQGHKTCAATVTASVEGGGQFELKSCYYAPLTDGRWTIRASLPGLPDALSTFEVEHREDCTRHVQSIELTLKSKPPIAVPAVTPLPVAPPAPATPPPPPPAADSTNATDSAEGPASTAQPSASPSPAMSGGAAVPGSATPAGSAAPSPPAPPGRSTSTGIFPDPTSHPSPQK